MPEAATELRMDLIESLYQRAAQQPDQLAYRFLEDSRQPVAESGEDTLLYGDLLQQVEHVAAHILEHSTLTSSAEARAVLAYPPGLDFVVAFLACHRLGITAVPMPIPGRRRRMQRFLDVVHDAKPSILLTLNAQCDAVAEGLQQLDEGSNSITVLATDTDVDIAASVNKLPAYHRPAANATAFLQYTSGSTGTPKGVMVSHANLLDNLQRICDRFGHNSNSRGVIWLPPYHDMGLIGGILQPLFVGFPVTLMAPASFLRSPLRWLQAIEHYGATTSGGPNFAYQHCIDRISEQDKADLDLSCWKVAFTGAELVRANTLENFARHFADNGFNRAAWLPCYGMAETTLLVTGSPVEQNISTISLDRTALEKSRIATSDNAESITRVGNGKAADEHDICIVDPVDCKPCASDRIGEIWLRGPSIASGYWQREAETGEAFGAHTNDGDGPWLRTGDLGFMHNDELYISGRLKELIILRGRNLYPQDIERCIENSHAALASDATAAFTVEVDNEERLVIVHEPPRRFDKNAIAEILSAIHASLSQEFDTAAHAIVFLKPGHLPLTPSGKVQRRNCQQQFTQNSLQALTRWDAAAQNNSHRTTPVTETLHSADEIERWMQAWLSRRLQCAAADIDIHRPLAEFGLDSLAAVDLATDLSTVSGSEKEISETIAWRYPTIAALARYVTSETAQQQTDASIAESHDTASQANTASPADAASAAALLAAELELAQRRNQS